MLDNRDRQTRHSKMHTKLSDLRVLSSAKASNDDATNHFELRALPSDIDHMSHVNNAVYLSWVQDVVVRHWTDRASDAEIENHLWIALKHEITYRRPAFLDDALHASVTATGFRGAKAMFDIVISRGDEVLAEIKSVWCCLDASTKRPMRVARDIISRFLGRPPMMRA